MYLQILHMFPKMPPKRLMYNCNFNKSSIFVAEEDPISRHFYPHLFACLILRKNMDPVNLLYYQTNQPHSMKIENDYRNILKAEKDFFYNILLYYQSFIVIRWYYWITHPLNFLKSNSRIQTTHTLNIAKFIRRQWNSGSLFSTQNFLIL